VILVAIIPAVVVTTLHKKNSMGPKSKVFVPLYVYPAAGAWSPLEEVYVLSIQSRPDPVSQFFASKNGQSQLAARPSYLWQAKCHVIWAPIMHNDLEAKGSKTHQYFFQNLKIWNCC
jgi:hypothetical protein